MCRSSCSNNNNNNCCRSTNTSTNTNCSNNNFNGIIYTTAGNENNGYAQSYVPNQVLGTPFSPMQGLQNGTMFPELVRSYCPGQSLEQMNYLRYGRGGCMC